MDELLNVLQVQLAQTKYIELYQQRVNAYKFLDSAYHYVDCRDCVEEAFDEWEQNLLSSFNTLTDLSLESTREQLLQQIADTRHVVDQRIKSNPLMTEGEQRLFDIVDSFRVVV
jgi:phage anti-repressor protein